MSDVQTALSTLGEETKAVSALEGSLAEFQHAITRLNDLNIRLYSIKERLVGASPETAGTEPPREMPKGLIDMVGCRVADLNESLAVTEQWIADLEKA